jgi:hypothetical protein
MSKCTTLFTTLMESLSRHLRPAPYPYGLLTLRLLGKLGGKNRQFLRDPMQLDLLTTSEKKLYTSINYKGKRSEDAMDDSDESNELQLPLPLRSCVNILREISMSIALDDGSDLEHDEEDNTVVMTIDPSSLWHCKIEDLDIQSYSKYVINNTRRDQAVASLTVLRAAFIEMQTEGSSNAMDVETNARDLSSEKLICTGLLYACTMDAINKEASTYIREKMLVFDRLTFSGSFASFMSEPSLIATKFGLQLLDYILGLRKEKDTSIVSSLLDALICSLCEACCACSWGGQYGLVQAIEKMTVTLGGEWSRKYEINIVNATLLAIKSQPRELSEAAVRALSGFIRVCNTLYGEHWSRINDDNCFVWDILSVEGNMLKIDKVHEGVTTKHRPSEDVFKIIVYEMTSPQQLVR